MYLIYSPMFCSFVIIFGDALMDLDGERFFSTRAEAQHAARGCGLRINNRNRIVPADEPRPYRDHDCGWSRDDQYGPPC